MAQENVEIVRRVFDLAFRERDLDAAMQLLDPEAEMDWSDSRAPYGAVYRGHVEIRGAWEGWQDAWEQWDPTIEEAIEADRETIVLSTIVHARGRGSGISVRARGASVWTVRDGRITRAKLFQSRAEALEAVGLPEPDARS